MKVFILIEETVFFHPEFMQDFLQNTVDEVVGAVLVTKAPKKNDIERYMMTHFYYLQPTEILKLGWNKVKFTILDRLDKERPHTVRRVLEEHHVPYIEVQNNINTPEYLNYIRKTEPDVILSSQPLYFGSELLNIPKLCCLNRHSGLLPKNGGVWPGFQAVRKGESETGVSVHTMASQIDAGVVLSQISVTIHPGESVWDIYEECFAKSAQAVMDALDKVRKGDYTAVENSFTREYYSFPTRTQWKEFRQHGGRYV